MEPITREEYYLAKIAGTLQGKTPEPVTIEEYYLATMAGDYSGNTPQPVTRLQYYMAKAAGVWGGSIPAPVTRLEYYWAAIANGEGTVFRPVTREEHFLALVADAYSVVITVVTGNPALLEGVKGSRFTALALHGKSTQGSTTGAQLYSTMPTEGKLINGITFGIKDGGLSLKGTAEGAQRNDEYFFKKGIDLSPGTYTISFSGKGNLSEIEVGISGDDKNMLLSSFALYNAPQKLTLSEAKTCYVVAQSRVGKSVDCTIYIMLNEGSTDKPYEPYTGGAPSPSPSYPQDIENAGQSGEIGIEVGNNGYIQKGTYFLDVRPFSLKKGYTYHIKCEKIITTTINCFVMNEYNKNFKNSAELYDYGYTTKKLTIPNSTGIVDKECMMPKRYDGDGYTFTVKAEGLYLYQAVNAPDKNTDELYIGYAPNILNEEYKKQTLIIPTPGGLPGIPVSTGGNYTDEKGQQWVADEIDLAMGERVQWVYHRHYASDELLYKDGSNYNIHTYKSEDVNIIDGIKHILVNVGRYNAALAQNNNYRSVIGGVRGRVDDIKSENDIKNVFPNGIDVWFIRKTPIRTPLPPETIAAYKALHTYSPTTTVINDAGAGMSVGYKKAK